MSLRCNKHNISLECIGGASAHPSNWYCPACDRGEGMRRIDWESKRPKLDLLLGKKTGPEIAQILDVSLTSLKWYCQKRSLSLFLDGKRRHEPMALKRLPTLSVDPERLWQIPAMPFKHVYMGNFT